MPRQGSTAVGSRDIELRQIRQAIAVVEQGGIAGAAQQLQLSPSSLSRSVAALERQLGTALFRRNGPSLTLTDLGRIFIDRGRALLAAAADLDRLLGLHPSLQAGRVVVGMGAAMCEATATAVAAQMMVDMPGVTLELRSSLRDDLWPPLVQGELDLLIADAVGLTKGGDHDVHPLPALPLVVVVRQGHALAASPRFEMKSVFHHPIYAAGRIQPPVLHRLLSEQSSAEGTLARTRPMPALTGNSVSMLLRLVEQTDCVTACSPALARPGVEAGTLVPLAAPPWLSNPYALVRPRSRKANPAAAAFFQQFSAAHLVEVAEAHRLIEAWLPQERPA